MMEIVFMRDKRILISFLLTLLLCAIFIPFFLNNILTGDEAVTLLYCKSNINSITEWAARDYHPPLYYYILYFVSKLSNGNIIAAKLLSVLPVFILLFLGFFILRKEFGYRAMIVWDALVCFFPYMFRYSVTVRMYSWAIFWVALAALSSWYIVKSNSIRSWIFFTITAIAAAYTHYYAFATAAFMYIILFAVCLVKKDAVQWRKFIVSAVVAIVAYLPWLFHFLSQTSKVVSAGFWAKETDILVILQQTFNSKYSISWVLWLITFVILIGIGLYRNIRKNGVSAEGIWHIGMLLAFPIIFGAVYVFSLVCTPIIVTRYLLIPLILLILGIAIETTYINKLFYGVLLAFFLFSGVVEYNYQLNLIEESTHNENIDLVEYGAVVCTSSWNTKNILNGIRPDLDVIYCAGQSTEAIEESAFYIADTYLSDSLQENAELIGNFTFITDKFAVYYYEEQ